MDLVTIRLHTQQVINSFLLSKIDFISIFLSIKQQLSLVSWFLCFSHVSLGQYWEKRNNEKILSKVGVWKKTIMGVVYRRGWVKTFRTLWNSTRGLFSTVRVVSLTMYILTINFLKHLLIKFLIQLEHIRKDLWVSVQIVPKL